MLHASVSRFYMAVCGYGAGHSLPSPSLFVSFAPWRVHALFTRLMDVFSPTMAVSNALSKEKRLCETRG
jgi:hypothetical protein